MDKLPNYRTDFRSIKGEVSPEEWQARVDLAACYRLIDTYGMTDLTYNHITVRVPGPEEHLLINLYGMLYKEITASSLAKIDLDGNVIWKPDTDYYVNKAGYVIHGCIHRARPDVRAVIHTHTRAGMAVAAMQCGLLPISQTSIRFENHIAYHDYEGPAVDLSEQQRLVHDLGKHNAMILRSHGLLTCGPSIPQCFNLMFFLENACRIQVDMLGCGRALHHATQPVIERTAEALSGTEITLENERETNPNLKRDAQKSGSGYGFLEWPALLRSLDRVDPSYRE